MNDEFGTYFPSSSIGGRYASLWSLLDLINPVPRPGTDEGGCSRPVEAEPVMWAMFKSP